MNFFERYFEKDIIFFKKLNDYNKKLIVYFLLFFFFFIICFVEKGRFISFLILLLFFLIWKILMELLLFFTTNNEKLKIFIRKYDNSFTVVIKILLFIQKWKNPILLLLLYLDKFLLKMIRNLIYNLKIRYNYDFTDNQLLKIFFLKYFIINLLLGPLKLFFGFVYTILCRMIEFPFSFFFIIRMIGFILGVLIFTNIFNWLYNQLGLFYLLIFIYIFFIFISCIVVYLDRDFEKLKIQYIKKFINTDYLINLRYNCTFVGILILNINRYKSSLINKKYIDITSSHLKIEIEEGFYKYWEFYKRNTWFNTLRAWKEIKNRPSFYLYLNFLAWLNVPSYILSDNLNYITNIIYIKYKADYLNIKLPDDIQADLNYLYTFFALRLKLLLFMIWDIDQYIGNANENYITYKKDEFYKIYNIVSDLNLYDFLNSNNFRVENKKEDLPFYDPDNNMDFFDRLYILIGFVPYNENPLQLIVFSNGLIKVKNLVDSVESRLFDFLNNVKWNRGWHYYIEEKEEQEMLLIEEKVKDWIIEFLKQSKDEWNFLLKSKVLAERNIMLLEEIEDLLKKWNHL